MALHRIVKTAFWEDGKIENFEPREKYFFLFLLTNPRTTQLGIYEFSIKQAAYFLGYTAEDVKELLNRFEHTHNLILFSPSTNEIAVKNFLVHSIIKGGAPVRDCLIKEMKQVKNKDLITQVFAGIKEREELTNTVRNIIEEYEEKNGSLSYSNEKDNDNEKENDVSSHDTSHDTSLNNPEKSKKKNNLSQAENARTTFNSLIPSYELHDAVVDKLREWCNYKIERREPYKEQGMKALLKRVETSCHQYGKEAVIDIIDESMANGWKGIIFDRLKEKQPRSTYSNDIKNRVDIVDTW